MNTHPELSDLLGLYVMGVLEPDEEREVEEHLEGCPACRDEARDLRLVHERLADLANMEETPPRELRDRVLTEIPGRRMRRFPLVAAAAAVLCAFVVLGVLFSTGFFAPEEVASADLKATDLAPGAGGEIQLYGSGDNMDVRLEAWGMPPCKADEYYELWFVGDEERVSGGSFTVGPSGRVQVDLNAPRLAGAYPQVGVTKETSPGPPGASDNKMLGGELHKL